MTEPRQLTIDGNEEALPGPPPVVVQPPHFDDESRLFDFPQTMPGQIALEEPKP